MMPLSAGGGPLYDCRRWVPLYLPKTPLFANTQTCVILELYLMPVMSVMIDASPVLVIAEVLAFYISRNCVLGHISMLDIDAYTKFPSFNRNNTHSVTSIGADTILF